MVEDLGAGRITGGKELPERLAVVERAAAGDRVRGGGSGPARALDGDLLRSERQGLRAVGGTRVLGAGAGLGGGGGAVALVVDLKDAVAVGRVAHGDDRDEPPAVVRQLGCGERRDLRLGAAGVAVGRAGLLLVGRADRVLARGRARRAPRYRADRPVGLAVHLGGEDLAASPVAVEDGRTAERVGHRDAAPGAVGEVVAVHATQVGGLLLGLGCLAGGAAADGRGDGRVAAEVVPGPGLGVGELGVVAVPGSLAVAVFVAGDLADGRAADQVLLGDRLDDGLVEPVVHRVRGGLAGQVPLDRYAGQGVAVLGRRHAAFESGALPSPVDDVDPSTGLGSDLLEAWAHEELALPHPALQFDAVDAVGHHVVLERDRRQVVDRRLPVAGNALDGVELEDARGTVTGVREALLQLPQVDGAVGGVHQDLGGDLGQPLGGEKRRRSVGAGAFGADLVDRNVRPGFLVGCGALALGTARCFGRVAALLDSEEDLRCGVEGTLGCALVVETLAVVDLAKVAGALVAGRNSGAAALDVAAAVLVDLSRVPVAGEVAV